MSSDPLEQPHEPIIVADVGGTNGRFAVAHYDAGGVRLSREQVYSNVGLPGFGDLLALYLDELGEAAPSRACFATAGPNDGRHGRLTNLNWPLDAGELESRFGLDEILFVNDFRALARMTPELPDSGSISLNPSAARPTGPGRDRPGQDRPVPAGPISVIGPGTGLGVAMVLRRGRETVTVATEGGHMAFAPGNALEAKLREHLAAEFSHVFAELLLSGNGIRRIHGFLVAEYGDGDGDLSAAEVTAAALAGDASCERTVRCFLSILGSIAGDVALCHGALGGVFLGGGIVKRIVPLIQTSDLCERFRAKGVMRDYLSGIPIRVITADQVARRGCALLYREHHREHPQHH